MQNYASFILTQLTLGVVQWIRGYRWVNVDRNGLKIRVKCIEEKHTFYFDYDDNMDVFTLVFFSCSLCRGPQSVTSKGWRSAAAAAGGKGAVLIKDWGQLWTQWVRAESRGDTTAGTRITGRWTYSSWQWCQGVALNTSGVNYCNF